MIQPPPKPTRTDTLLPYTTLVRSPQTIKWVTQYEPTYVLSMCALYLMAHPAGIDPEATGELEFHHHYLELLQAFALCQPRRSEQHTSELQSLMRISYAVFCLKNQKRLLTVKQYTSKVTNHTV